MKVINDLVGFKDRKIVQNPDWFMFSLESILLPTFVTLNKKIKRILELGTGNAPIPLVLSTRTVEIINSIEIQEELYNLAEESVKLNKLEDQIRLINDDMKNISKYFEPGSLDLIITNPPYFKKEEESKLNDSIQKTIARHEITISLEEILAIAKTYLDNRGLLAIVHRASRLIEVIELMRKNSIEPKRMRFIYPKAGKEANMFLLEGVKNGNIGLKILPPLVVHNQDGTYTEEVLNFFSAE